MPDDISGIRATWANLKTVLTASLNKVDMKLEVIHCLLRIDRMLLNEIQLSNIRNMSLILFSLF